MTGTAMLRRVLPNPYREIKDRLAKHILAKLDCH